MRRAPLSILVAAAAFAPLSRAEVWTVGGSTPDFPEIAAAVQAASDGDLVLVWPGSYASFLVDDLDLTILAVANGAQVDGTVRVHSLGVDRAVELIGISAAGQDNVALIVYQCDGAVRVRGGVFQGAAGTSSLGENAYAGAWVSGCADVSFTECELRGGQGEGRVGLELPVRRPRRARARRRRLDGQRVRLDARRRRRELGLRRDVVHRRRGRQRSELLGRFPVRRRLERHRGGRRQRGATRARSSTPGGSGGDGGHGLAAFGATLVTLDTQASGGSGGPGGLSWTGVNPAGQDGEPVELGGGATHSALPGTAPTLEVPRLVEDTSALQLDYAGDPGDAVFLVVADLAGFRFVPSWYAPLLIRAPFVVDRDLVGAIGAGGTLAVGYPLPDLPAGEFRVWYLQSALIAPGPSVRLTPVVPVVVHDAGW